jgi:RNA polymerase sigma-70 factor (ECF subfamily)
VLFRVSHKENAEDITEDVFIKAFSNLNSLSEDAAFEGWLYQIARNKIIDHYRSRKKTLDINEFENTLEYDSTIIDSINLDFDQKILLKAIEQLKPDEQQIIKLRFFEELDTETSAKILNKSAGAVRVLQHRSIAKLKIILEARTNEQN